MVSSKSQLADTNAFPSITNQGYFSDFFFAYRLKAGLADLYEKWNASEKVGDPTPRTQVRSLSTAFDKYRVDAVKTSPDEENLEGALDLGLLDDDGVQAMRDLNDEVLNSLGWTPERDQVMLISGEKALHVPHAHRAETPSGTLLLVLETVFASDPATVVADKEAPSGTLLDPITIADKAEGRTVLEAAQLIFTADQPPRYLLICSGGGLTLLDRERWVEGVFLGVDLDDAVARGDAKAKGELAAVAALFSADSINPGEKAQSVLNDLQERAKAESAGVSKELRHGVRRSVELLANAVVDDIRNRQKGKWLDIDPDELTRQCLRYLYRIIVLLYAEARPELGILPTDDPDYQNGYSLARLREVALTDLQSPHAKNGNHLQTSLGLLFSLVNTGYEPPSTLDTDARGLTFPGLGSSLFSEKACPMLDRARITDETLQQVLSNLVFSQEKAGQQKQALSYATLGINQLGAVYEGLMAYRGFLATEELYELDDDGDPDTGTWVIPVDDADEFDDEVFLKEEGPDGVERRVRYREGDFVFRLSGRDRQRSASYYTPEVLTEFTVRHALDVYWEENPNLTAEDILNLTVCEPALGSGAFLNEAINQLAERYLKSAQDESGERIDPNQYQLELQRAKAHFALNRAYGVDLNRTAVELAEVSLWLNCMFAGLGAPSFGTRLRRGNSLIGARRATYSREDVVSGRWRSHQGKQPTPPTDRPISAEPLGDVGGIHHFLLPGEGWGSAADAAEVKELEPDWAKDIRNWRRDILKKPSPRQTERLGWLAKEVEKAWRQSRLEVERIGELSSPFIEVWSDPRSGEHESVHDRSVWGHQISPGPATHRLRLLMDAWCSLWVWGPENGARLPDLDEWLSAIESILNVKQGPRTGLLFEEDDVDLDPNLEWRAAVTNKYPWLEECITIAETSGWLHWELEFSPVFGAGGFDLVLGNPPWTKVTRTDTDVLIDAEPSWAIHGVPRDPDQYSREKESLLKDKELRIDLLTESASSQGLSRLLSARTRFPMTSATITNLYLCFMEQAFRLMAGACGLLHQESFFEDHKAPRLRSEVMLRLRRHWHFMNELLLFEEVHHETEFGVHIYGRRLATPAHLYAANLLHPTTADRSLERFQLGDRSGELPGKKTSDGEWDIRPHAARLIEVNETALRAFARLERIEYQIDAPPRPLRLYSDVELELLELLTDRPRSVGALGVMFSSGIHESSMARPGPKQLIEKRVAIPDSLENTVLKGPNVNVANPCYQQANAGYSHSNDLEIIDLHSIEESFLPRTVIQVVADPTIIRRRLHEKDGWDSAGAWRVMWPEHVSRGIVRMFQPALIPPLILHGHSCMTASTPDSGDLLRLASVGSTAVYELLLRMLGTDHIGEPELSGLPWPPEDHPAWPLMEARCLRLNAVTRFHAEMWAACFSTTWLDDTSVLNDSRAPVYNHIHAEWDFGSAIRGELARWITLAEMDALAALLFDIPLELLLTVYGLHLGLQARYDQRTVFDADGYKIAADRYNMGTKQRKTAEYGLAIDVREGRRLLGETEGLEAYSEPFTKFERTDLVESAHRQFSTRLGLSR